MINIIVAKRTHFEHRLASCQRNVLQQILVLINHFDFGIGVISLNLTNHFISTALSRVTESHNFREDLFPSITKVLDLEANK
jgi:hypothetical protein